MTIANLRGKFLLSLALGALVFLALAIYADFDSLLQAFRTFNWILVIPILLLTLFNYGTRLVKWDFYMRVLQVENLSRWDSWMIFLSGLSMAMTPAKAGEWLKSYLLKEASGTPFMRSAPVIVAERLSDGVAMVLLALVGVVAFGFGSEFVLLGAVIVVGAIVVVQVRPLALFFLGIGARLPVLGPRIDHFHTLYESAYTLFRPQVMIPAILLGLLGWGAECVAMFLVFVGLGLTPTPELLIQSTFILAASTLAGALLLLPGGLLVAEATIVGLSQALLDLDRGSASAAALIIRLFTLWFGVLVGVVALLVYLRSQDAAKREALLAGLESDAAVAAVEEEDAAPAGGKNPA